MNSQHHDSNLYLLKFPQSDRPCVEKRGHSRHLYFASDSVSRGILLLPLSSLTCFLNPTILTSPLLLILCLCWVPFLPHVLLTHKLLDSNIGLISYCLWLGRHVYGCVYVNKSAMLTEASRCHRAPWSWGLLWTTSMGDLNRTWVLCQNFMRS